MNILIFSWKDIKNPTSGGAEIVTQELAKRWVHADNSVTIFTSQFPDAPSEENLDGVKIIRRGRAKTSVFLWAYHYYQRKAKGNFDIVIDEIHGLPFFTNLYVKEPVVALIHEVAKEIWYLNLPFPISLIGRTLERMFLDIYQETPFLVPSPSTQKDLLNVGIKEVHQFPEGTNLTPPTQQPRKTTTPTLISLGRLVPHKQIEEIIKAAAKLNEKREVHLWILGRGRKDYKQSLRSLVSKLNLESQVSFFGYTDQREKLRRLQKSWILVSASAREGWGLNIIEAGIMGTPAVVYNSPGLRDAVKDNQTGLICRDNTSTDLADKIRSLVDNPALRNKLGKNAQEWNQQFNWNKSAKICLDVLQSITSQRSRS